MAMIFNIARHSVIPDTQLGRAQGSWALICPEAMELRLFLNASVG